MNQLDDRFWNAPAEEFSGSSRWRTRPECCTIGHSQSRAHPAPRFMGVSAYDSHPRWVTGVYPRRGSMDSRRRVDGRYRASGPIVCPLRLSPASHVRFAGVCSDSPPYRREPAFHDVGIVYGAVPSRHSEFEAVPSPVSMAVAGLYIWCAGGRIYPKCYTDRVGGAPEERFSWDQARVPPPSFPGGFYLNGALSWTTKRNLYSHNHQRT